MTVAVLVACYLPVLRGMVEQWSTDEDMGHGFVVPFVIGWIVWRERGRWRKLPLKPSWWGFALLALAAMMQVAAELGAGLFAGSVAFLLSVTGAVIALGGVRLLRAWAFPLLLALFMLPKLAIVYNQVTLPMQLLASRMAAGILSASSVAVIRQGNILDIGGHQILVAEACNGIRYLLPLAFMGAVFGYLSDPKSWMRAALLAVAIPVAIIANALRVAAAAFWPALEAGFAHMLCGWLIFVLCLAALVVARQAINAAYGLRHA